MAVPYYADDSVTLYHGDCLEVQEWLSADVLVTDPPYGKSWRRGVNKAKASKPHPGILNDSDSSYRDAAVQLWGDRPGVVFGSLYGSQPQGLKQVLIWHKPPDSGVVGSVTGYRRDVEAVYLIGVWPPVPVRHSSILRSSIPNMGNPSSPAGRTGHPHAKPVDLMEQLICSSPAGVVADPLTGSGTTLVAAKLAGRKAVGVELDESYCEVAALRVSQGVLDFSGVAAGV